MEDSAHFLITLFNLALWEHDKNRASTRTDAWLDSRIELFERYCLPSVMAQRGCARFTWLVMFDAATPEPVRRRIESWRRRCRALTPLFFTADQVKGFTGRSTGRRVDFITGAIRSHLDGTERTVVTTNLDNDDALADDALARIQQAVAHARDGKTVISLVNGMQYFPALGAVMQMRYPHNHFLSLVEPAGDEISTIESMSHRQARRNYKVVDLAGAPGWLEVVHGGNVSNELRITSRIRYRMFWRHASLAPFGLGETWRRRALFASNLRLIGKFISVAVWRLGKKISKK